MIVEIKVKAKSYKIDSDMFETSLLERNKTFLKLPGGTTIVWMGGLLEPGVPPSEQNIFCLHAEIPDAELDSFSAWLHSKLQPEPVVLFINHEEVDASQSAIQHALYALATKH